VKLIFENWRRYLNEEFLVEVSYDSALETVKKVSKKAIKGLLYDKGRKAPSDYDPFDEPRRFPDGRERKQTWRLNPWAEQYHNLVEYVIKIIPNDIEEGQQATALLWIARLIKKNPEVRDRILATWGSADTLWPMKGSLETFFQWQQFMPERDLNKIKSFSELKVMVDNAKDTITAYQEKQSYLDADEGTEVLVDDADDWKIAIMHNKGAACELGKGTDWCTAAPGLNYFEEYYEPDDPLFYFEDRGSGPWVMKFQFHYGSGQFMDEEDKMLEGRVALELHQLLVGALGERINEYPKVKEAQLRLEEMEDGTDRSEWTDHDLALAFDTNF